MTQSIILPAKRSELVDIVRRTFSISQPHSKMLAIRILGKQYLLDMGVMQSEFPGVAEAKYGGYPELAAQGFMLAAGENIKLIDTAEFLDGIRRLKSRTKSQSFVNDDIALLGLAEGMNHIMQYNTALQTRECSDWLLEIMNSSLQTELWSWRMRVLARNLLDKKNSLQTFDLSRHVDAQALELTIRDVWQEQFIDVSQLPEKYFENLFTELLLCTPDPTDLEKAICWLHSIDLIIKHSSKALFPRTDKEKIAVKRLTIMKVELDKQATIQVRRIIWVWGGLLIAFWGSFTALGFVFTWSTMEIWLAFLAVPIIVVSYIYFAVTHREFSLSEIYEQLKKARTNKLYRKSGFDLEEYETLTK